MKFNVNHNVKIKLTKTGVKVIKDYYDEANIDYEIKLDEDGYFQDQMWHVMKMFGSKMVMGGEELLENITHYSGLNLPALNQSPIGQEGKE